MHDHQEINVGIGMDSACRVGPKKNDLLGMKPSNDVVDESLYLRSRGHAIGSGSV